MRKKVLLLGNGIARAYYKADSWNKILSKIQNKKIFHLQAEDYDLPLPFKMEMFANGEEIKNIKNEDFLVALKSLDEKKDPHILRNLINLNFDCILTTNYTYEVECAILNQERFLFDEMKQRHQPETIDPEIKNNNLLYSFNLVKDRFYPDKQIKVYHIHGEGLFPQNIVIGHNSYSNLLKSYIDYFYDKRNGESWLEKFVENDVYILGFGMDFSEIDLWWLLHYKWKNNPQAKTIYFNPKHKRITSCGQCKKIGNTEWCKTKMLKIYGVEVRDISFDAGYKNKYNNFYEQACERIEKDFEKEENN